MNDCLSHHILGKIAKLVSKFDKDDHIVFISSYRWTRNKADVTDEDVISRFSDRNRSIISDMLNCVTHLTVNVVADLAEVI